MKLKDAKVGDIIFFTPHDKYFGIAIIKEAAHRNRIDTEYFVRRGSVKSYYDGYVLIWDDLSDSCIKREASTSKYVTSLDFYKPILEMNSVEKRIGIVCIFEADK